MAVLLFLFLFTNEAFIVDASTEATYKVELSRETLRGYVDDIGLFARNMPGVVAVRPLGSNKYLYQTEKTLPLAGKMSTDFLIQKSVIGDSVTLYRSVSIEDPNYMSCRVMISPLSEESTQIQIRLRLRLSRANASDIHWLAPVLGNGFISDRMQEDMEDMLKTFIERSNKELYARLPAQTTSR